MTPPPARDASAGARPLNVIVVDDQALVRGAMAALLDLNDDITVVGQAGDGAEALRTIADCHSQNIPVDVVLMDIEMPTMDGIMATEAIRARHPNTRVLIVTTFGRPGYVQRALAAGASGFVVKDAPAEELADALRRVDQGQRVVAPELALEALSEGASPLTDREVEVMRVVARGLTLSDVALLLGLSQGTVRNYVSSVMTKTGARTRAEAAAIAAKKGWL